MARAKADEDVVDTPDDSEAVTKGEVRDMISGALEEIKGLLTGHKDDETASSDAEGGGETAGTDTDELPSPRRVELDTERAVRDAIGGIHINIGGREEEKPKAPPKEESPARSSKLEQFIWGKSA